MATRPKAMRIPDELWAEVVAIAGARGDTVTAIVVARLEEYRTANAHLIDGAA